VTAPGRHRRPPLYRRALASLRARHQGRQVKKASARLVALYSKPGALKVTVLPDRPRLHRRILGRLLARRQRRQVEEARGVAYVVRIAAHAIPPQAKAQAALTALYGVLHHEHGGDASAPPAAVLPDEDVPGLEHLQRAWSEETGTFRALAEGWTE